MLQNFKPLLHFCMDIKDNVSFFNEYLLRSYKADVIVNLTRVGTQIIFYQL